MKFELFPEFALTFGYYIAFVSCLDRDDWEGGLSLKPSQHPISVSDICLCGQ